MSLDLCFFFQYESTLPSHVTVFYCFLSPSREVHSHKSVHLSHGHGADTNCETEVGLHLECILSWRRLWRRPTEWPVFEWLYNTSMIHAKIIFNLSLHRKFVTKRSSTHRDPKTCIGASIPFCRWRILPLGFQYNGRIYLAHLHNSQIATIYWDILHCDMVPICPRGAQYVDF